MATNLIKSNLFHNIDCVFVECNVKSQEKSSVATNLIKSNVFHNIDCVFVKCAADKAEIAEDERLVHVEAKRDDVFSVLKMEDFRIIVNLLAYSNHLNTEHLNTGFI